MKYSVYIIIYNHATRLKLKEEEEEEKEEEEEEEEATCGECVKT